MESYYLINRKLEEYPLISVIVPVYKVEKYLDKCIKSITNQTYTNLEIILVDDGSPDKCGMLCDLWCSRDKRIKVIHKKNGGLSDARNVGITEARGKYVGFVDSDDYIDKDMYLKLYNKATLEKSDIALCGYYKSNGKELELCKMQGNNEFGSSIKKNPELIKYSYAFSAVHLFKKELIDKNKIIFEDYKIFEDLLFTYKSYKHANKIVKVFEPLYYYRTRNDGTSVTQGFSKNYTQIFDVMNELKEYYKGYIPQEYITYLALKHIFIRFRTKTSLKKLITKYKFVNRAFKYLDDFDSNWKENSFFESHKKSKHFSTLYWIIAPMKVGTTK